MISPIPAPMAGVEDLPESTTEYATQGAGRKHRSALPHLCLVAPLRPERASRGFFAVLITVMLAFGLVIMLLVNTSVAQTAFTVSELKIQQRDLSRAEAALTKAIAEAASRLGCSVRTLQRLARDGRISFVRRGRCAFVLREDLARLEVGGRTDWLVNRLADSAAESMRVAEWFRHWIELQRLLPDSSERQFEWNATG